MLPWSIFPRQAPGGDSEPEPEAYPSEQLSDEALVEDLLAALAAARSFQEFRRSQRKESFGLQRWLQLVLPLIQEIREIAPSLSDDAYRRLALLGRAFHAARRLLRCCHDGSKIFLVIIEWGAISFFLGASEVELCCHFHYSCSWPVSKIVNIQFTFF
jgi:hypothetical protein